MNSSLVLSTEGLLPGTIPSLASRNLRAQLFRSAESGFAAWLTLRPVVWEGARAALLLVQQAGASQPSVIGVIAERVAVLHAEEIESGLLVYTPWEQRDQVEMLIVDIFDHSRVQEAADQVDELPSGFRGDVEVITLTSDVGDSLLSVSGGPGETGADSERLGLQSRPGQAQGQQILPRFTQTPEGAAARSALLALGNGVPGLLDRLSPREWALPFGIRVREVVRLRSTKWEICFNEIAAEQMFISMCRNLAPPLVLDSSDDGAQDEGITIIQSVCICAPAADTKARKGFASLLWDLVNEVWLMQQRDLLMAATSTSH